MRGQTVSFLYVLNIVMQALFSLLFAIAIFFGLGWLAVTYLGAPQWVYAPFILIGVGTGVISMVRFILTAMAGLDRLENQHDKKENTD